MYGLKFLISRMISPFTTSLPISVYPLTFLQQFAQVTTGYCSDSHGGRLTLRMSGRLYQNCRTIYLPSFLKYHVILNSVHKNEKNHEHNKGKMKRKIMNIIKNHEHNKGQHNFVGTSNHSQQICYSFYRFVICNLI